MNQNSNRPVGLGLMIALLGLTPSAWAVTVSTTGVYDEQVVQPNAVNSSAAGGLTVGDFTTMVSDAFAAEIGGVVDFDDFGENTTLASGAGQSFTAAYGVSQANGLVMTSTGGSYLVRAQTTSISGGWHLASGDQSISLAFGTPLAAFGITVLNRNRVFSSMVFTLEDGTTVSPFASQTVNDDRFFGYAVSDLTNGIVAVAFNSSQHQHYDDMGFIIAVPPAEAVVPEPSSLGLFLAAVGMGLLRRRRRRGRRGF